MSTTSLDEAEKQAHEMLSALRREYELQAAPYLKRLLDIHALRPKVFYVPMENGKLAEMIPLDPQNSEPNVNEASP